MKRKDQALLIGTGLLLLLTVGGWPYVPGGPESLTEVLNSRDPMIPQYPYTVEQRSTLSEALGELGVPALDVYQMVRGAEKVVDLSRIKPGVRFNLSWTLGPVRVLEAATFEWSPTHTIHLSREAGQWQAQGESLPTQTRLVTFQGNVNSSLWVSAQEAGMDSRLIGELAEIFAWQVDFAREVRQGDRWRLVVEEIVAGNVPKVIGFGKILAAEYWNQGEHYSAVWFSPSSDGPSGYYAEDGSSLRRMFLKSPIEFGRISSRFSRVRFHPVLKFARPHLGVDYAAPIGTPIRAVGDGIVGFAGPLGAGGNAIKIRHNSTYSTAYKHLSRFAANLHPGKRVHQGEIIGYVGATGLASGPHLHFEFYQNGTFVDPMGKRFPHADPVPSAWAPAFLAVAGQSRALLPAWRESDKKLTGAEQKL